MLIHVCHSVSVHKPVPLVACRLYFDGAPKTAFWKSDRGDTSDRLPAEGGVSPTVVAQTLRFPEGSLVLGQDQDCLGSCFHNSNAFDGNLAVLRVWKRALAQDEVRFAVAINA